MGTFYIIRMRYLNFRILYSKYFNILFLFCLLFLLPFILIVLDVLTYHHFHFSVDLLFNFGVYTLYSSLHPPPLFFAVIHLNRFVFIVVHLLCFVFLYHRCGLYCIIIVVHWLILIFISGVTY